MADPRQLCVLPKVETLEGHACTHCHWPNRCDKPSAEATAYCAEHDDLIAAQGTQVLSVYSDEEVAIIVAKRER